MIIMSALSDLRIPVFWTEGQPDIRREGYTVEVAGLVERPGSFGMEKLFELATDTCSCRLTSVTRWSVRLDWRGIRMGRFLSFVQPLPETRFVKFTSFGGTYFTVVGREDLDHPRAILALAAEGEDLPVEYGGPVRALFPHLWGYKSAKSVVRIDFQKDYEPGYWETRGYDDGGTIAAAKLFDLNSRRTLFHPGGEVTW
jgi:DMSO/TMAO reductase YedYZ molybdopterin-dependent catalytic subunit